MIVPLLIRTVILLISIESAAGAARLRHHYLLDGSGVDEKNLAPLTAKGNSVVFNPTGGIAGGFVRLGGTDDYLLASADEGSNLSVLGDYSTFKPFSITFWIRQTPTQASSSTQAIFGITTSSTDSATYNTGFEVISRETASLGLRVRARQGGGGSNGGEINTNYTVSDGTWRHVTVVYEAASRSVYVDGVFRGTNTTAVAITTNPLKYFSIGAFIRAGNILDDFTGDVDDFQIYEGALTAEEAFVLHRHPGNTLEDHLDVTDLDAVDLVDPLVGAEGTGNCVPGPCLPNASIYPSPDTLAAAPGGYKAGSNVVGFAQLHPQGSGPSTMSYGNFLVSPKTGSGITESSHQSAISNVEARAYSYRARLNAWDTACTVVPAANSAIYEFDFPASDDARIYFDVARKQNSTTGMKSGTVTIDPTDGSISGGGEFDGNWNPASYNLFFYAKVDRSPASVGTWIGSATSSSLSASTTTRQRVGGWMRFNTTGSRKVRMKIGISFVSVERARAHVEREIPQWDLEGLEQAAKAKWSETLSVLKAPGIGLTEGRSLYTALFHSLVQPRNRTADASGSADGPQLWDDHYTLWDTWQTLFPLLAITHPDIVAANVNSFATRYQQNGRAETAFIQGKDFQVGQGGDEVDLVVGDALAKKIPGIDWEAVWPLLQFHAARRTADYRNLGYVSSDGDRGGYDSRMRSGSSTLAFAYEDWCSAQVAASLGKTGPAEALLARSGNWKNVWDASLSGDGFSGFVRARARSGTFSTSAATDSSDFYQGTCWNYSFNVPHERDEMIRRMGGRARFIQRLEFALGKNSTSYIDFTNEPCFQTISLFSHSGRPYLTSKWMDALRQRFGSHSFPGDEDSGAMSSLYFFLTSGFFPIAGQDIYYLHGARVPRLEFHQAGGKIFTVTAENAGPDNIYIQSAKLDGVPLDFPWIRHADILAGRTLDFVMGANPSTWGTGMDFKEAPKNELILPVRGPWVASVGTPVISRADSDSPVWGSGIDNARSTSIHSPFPEITLSHPGDAIRFSADIRFSGLSPALDGSVELFAWGLFKAAENGENTGWAGYLAASDKTDSSGARNLFRKAAGTSSNYGTPDGGTGVASFSLPSPPLAGDAYRMTLALQRTPEGSMDYQASLVRTRDGVIVSAFTGSDPQPASYVFNRVGLRLGSGLDADTVSLENCTVVATRTRYTGRELVIPEGGSFRVDSGSFDIASMTNHGTIELTGGMLRVDGNLTSTGTIRLKGQGLLDIAGAFSNSGVFDTINSSGSYPANILNSGILLNRDSVRFLEVSRSGNKIRLKIMTYEGHGYQLQTDAGGDLSGPWLDVGTTVSGKGEPMEFQVETGTTKSFFRVKVSP